MRSLMLIVLSLALVNCGRSPAKTDKRLLPVVTNIEANFKNLAGVDLKINIPITIEPLKGSDTVFAVCKNKSKIIVDERIYNLFSGDKDLIELLILHELGHCIYNLEHDSNIAEDPLSRKEIAESVMFPNAFMVVGTLNEYKIYYYNQLVYGTQKAKHLFGN